MNYIITLLALPNPPSIDSTSEAIPRATLNIDGDINGGRAQYFLSNNGGLTWEEIVPGIRHNFSSAGSDLRWKVTLYPALDFHTSPVIRSLTIRYVDNQAGDAYEPDDSCLEAQTITTDGGCSNIPSTNLMMRIGSHFR